MAVSCFDVTGITYAVVSGLTGSVTGSYFLSLLMIVLLFMTIVVAFRMPVEISAVLVLPLLIALLACDGDWMSITGVTLIYLGILVGKNFFFRS